MISHPIQDPVNAENHQELSVGEQRGMHSAVGLWVFFSVGLQGANDKAAAVTTDRGGGMGKGTGVPIPKDEPTAT